MPERLLDFPQVLALLTEEELRLISQRAEQARDEARDPWPLIFEGISVSAELALLARQATKTPAASPAGQPEA
jgi:hypothetical protein